MSKIGNPNDGQFDRWSGDYPAQAGFDGRDRPSGRGSGGRADGPLKASGWSRSLDASLRAAAFEKGLHHAVRNLGDDEGVGNQPGQNRTFAQAQLLAIAQSPMTGLPSPGAAQSADASSPSTAAIVASVTEYIQQSIRADAMPVSGQVLKLSLAFGGDVAGEIGLTGISLSVTATTLDVVLERAGSEASESLLRAARILSERLMTRFSKQTVRILDRITPDAQAAAAELASEPGGVGQEE